jgi:hypothetical protein
MKWARWGLIAVALACNPKKAGSEDAGTAATTSASAASSSSAPVANAANDADKCVVAIDHGMRVGVGDTERATIAAAGDDAILAIVETWTASNGMTGTRTVRGVFDAKFPVVKFDESPAAYGGEESGSVGAAVAFGGKPHTITFGNGGNGGWADSSQFLVAPAGTKAGAKLKATHTSKKVAAAGRDDLAVAVSVGIETNGNDPNLVPKFEKSKAARAFTWDGKTAKSAVILDDKDEPNAVAVAVGKSQAAAVIRAGRKLWVVRIGSDAARIGDPIELATGEVGSPAAVFAGDSLHVVWAQADAKGAPYQLKWANFDPSHGAPEARASGRIDLITPLDTKGASSFSPTLAVHKDHVLLAWMEGDASKTGLVRLSRLDGGKWGERAETISRGTNARDPRIAASDAGAWIVWSEFSSALPKGDLRASRITCAPDAMSKPGLPDAPVVVAQQAAPKKCETYLDCDGNEECASGTCAAKCPRGQVILPIPGGGCGAACAQNPEYGKACPKGQTCMLTSNITGGCVKDE